ncbi:CHAD domain-containing protein [Arthrobacter sp. 49Tsu3.1M3]|uniref:CYTH and CHAD domain-containing protein n=1 Tax=Arthrobacter sp. 49Tsu3.1M3 TaxID=1279029 RepID=UPI0009A7EF1C|nr:CYTH and CHAD domain-containing protein [Arthrobacter sp. 49Tsu3.1M3]SKB99125.1 CHAD domain-containing protein [Arthrobacter sp. 49Tsu3.1M3]
MAPEAAAGSDERTEFREPLGEPDDGVPDALLRLVRVHTRGETLVPVARLRTKRTVYRLRNKKDAVLADISDDRVQAEVLAPIPGTRRWREWEIEITAAPGHCSRPGRTGSPAPAARPSTHQSKLARALNRDPVSPGPVPAPKRKGPAGDVMLAYLKDQVRELKEQDPLVREDTHDAVHKMRVATRRMRSVLATYRKLLDDAETVKNLREELKWLAGVLGEARDAEVMHARLKEMVAHEPGELVMGPVTRRVDLELGGAYQKAHEKALKALDGQRYFRLLDSLDALVTVPHLSALASQPAVKVIPGMVERDVKRLRTAVKEAKRHPAGTGDHPALHEARKDGKRLRYAAEAAAPVNPKQAARLADAAHGVQKILGDHQDSVVTRQLLRRLGAEAFTLGENGFSYGRLHALEQTLALEAEAQFHRQWKKFPATPL